MGADTKRREARKRKFGADAPQKLQIKAPQLEDNESVADEPPKKQSKQDIPTPTSPKTCVGENDETGSTPITTDIVAENQNLAAVRVQRFIVFIGNLPYTATDDTIRKHFAKVQPKSIRHRTEKEGRKSKGFAFLEFECYDRMKTCLKIFQGLDFDDGISAVRKLNVELTWVQSRVHALAETNVKSVGGGGGKSSDRKSKLRDKNERLNEQRKRRALEKGKQGKKVEDKKSMEEGKARSRQGKEDIKLKKGPKPETFVDHGDIHPSRRSRMGV